MKIFGSTYTDLIKFNRKPNEDFLLISEKYPIFALADGVTQSRFEDGKYAYPAGARVAAQIFCQSVVEYLEKNFRPTEKIIEKAFDFANERIWELNKNEGIIEKMDYVVYDYFDTVGVAGFLANPVRNSINRGITKYLASKISNGANNTLFYGYVGDCGLAVFAQNNKLKFQTKDRVEPAVKKAKGEYKNWRELSQNERTKIMHQYFRNQPLGFGYGSFTGEPGVKKYYQINSLVLNPGELIVFYSDGFVEYLKLPEFIEILRREDKKALDDFTFNKAKENYGKFGTDRTLISFSIK